MHRLPHGGLRPSYEQVRLVAPPFKRTTAPERDDFESEARLLWKAWGQTWVLSTLCSLCETMKHCRGRKRARMLCLECFDQGAR